jgi:hypothetical protein
MQQRMAKGMRGCALLALLVAVNAAAAAGSSRVPRPGVAGTGAQRMTGGARLSRLSAFPEAIYLRGHDPSQQLLLTGVFAPDDLRDLTTAVVYHVSDPRVVSVTRDGRVTAAGDGSAIITAAFQNSRVKIPATVSGSGRDEPVSFVQDVEPILARAGCNAGGCHGKATGQNGFRLSLFGFDPLFDYNALVAEGRGRRVSRSRPEDSLLLRKATAVLPHGGGRRLEVNSASYQRLRQWIAQGMLYEQQGRPTLTRLSLTPAERLMRRGATQQLAVTAHYSDGSTRDVTRDALFRSNEEGLATVDERGRVTTSDHPGEAAVMASYMGQVAVFRAAVPLGAPASAFGPFPSNNYVDDLVFRKLRGLGIPPSGLCSDAEFIRRVSLDLCGRLPKPDEVRAFLADPDPNKRRGLIDRLLDDPDYASFFALKWSSILRNTGQYRAGAYAFRDWIRQAIAANKPYDRFVREIVAAQGEWEEQPPVAWYWQFRDGGVDELVGDVGQLFLGVRMQCARCHHHPYEKWSQDDYYGLVGFFTRMGRKILKEPAYYYAARKVTVGNKNPRTGKTPEPKFLDGPELKVKPGDDPRRQLSDWLAEPNNPFLAPAICNRIWAHFMGRGLVEPIDDIRVTNPPSNPALLQALSRDLIRHQFDLKYLIRTITNSRTYQLSSAPNPYNGADQQNYARCYPKRLLAEVLLDAVDQLTGVKTNWTGVSSQARAIDLPHEEFGSYFLDVFGRPRQLSSPCECARDSGANLSQVLHLVNSGELDNKIASGSGRAAALARPDQPLGARIDDLYLWAFGRPPDPTERAQATRFIFAEKDTRKAFEELIWTLINCREFQFNH